MYVEIDELDEEEPVIVGPAPKRGTPYVDVPVSVLFSLSSQSDLVQRAPKATGKTASSSGLREYNNADTTSPVWSPGCGACVRRQLICRQGYNANHEPLAVCAHCHHAKNKCGGNGSVAATKGKRPATTRARSKSRRRTSPAHVTVVTDGKFNFSQSLIILTVHR